MELANLITPERILANLKATSKKQALQEIAKHISEVTGQNDKDIFNIVIEREKLGTTGVGDGIAIPHGKLETLEEIIGFFARLERPIDFDSVDERPVDLIFLLLAPETAGAEHLKALACISRYLRNKTNCKKLRGSNNPEALYALLIEDGKHQAA